MKKNWSVYTQLVNQLRDLHGVLKVVNLFSSSLAKNGGFLGRDTMYLFLLLEQLYNNIKYQRFAVNFSVTVDC